MTNAGPRGARPELRGTLAALACGWIAGVAVATAIEVLIPKSGPLAMSLGDELWFSLVFGLFRGAIVMAICVPCWLMLRRIGRSTWLDAIALGYLTTFAMQFLLSLPMAAPDYGGLASISALFAVAGAAGGLVTWLVGYVRR